MKKLNCICCGSDDYSIILTLEGDDYYGNLINKDYSKSPRNWVKCNNCGFIYQNPQLDANDMKILYDKFRDFSLRNETPDDYFDRITSLAPEKSENYSKVATIKKYLPELINVPGKILDIGCGGGVFLYTFSQHFHNWQLNGVEPTVSFAELASRRLKSNVIAESYEQGIAGSDYDLIILNHVIEHTEDPKDFLKSIFNDLNDGGYLYLECPHEDDFNLLDKSHDRFKLQHNWYFGFDSFRKIIEASGFKEISIHKDFTVRKRNNLVAILKKIDK